jgi:hypothetical protein
VFGEFGDCSVCSDARIVARVIHASAACEARFSGACARSARKPEFLGAEHAAEQVFPPVLGPSGAIARAMTSMQGWECF